MSVLTLEPPEPDQPTNRPPVERREYSAAPAKAPPAELEDAMARPDSVVVVNDHRTFAELLSLAIGETADLVCLGHAVSAEEARTLVERVRPDIVIMDVALPDGDGIALTRELCLAHPQLRIVVLTSHGQLDMAMRAAAAGAAAFVPKDCSLKDVLTTLRGVQSGTMMIAPGMLANGAAGHGPTGRAEAADATDRFTPRELDVLGLLSEGSTPCVSHGGWVSASTPAAATSRTFTSSLGCTRNWRRSWSPYAPV